MVDAYDRRSVPSIPTKEMFSIWGCSKNTDRQPWRNRRANSSHLRDMGIDAATVYSQADSEALHVKLADEAYEIGPPEALESYLHFDRIFEAVEKSGADAIHPGYGFLAENAEFVERCEDKGIALSGRPASAWSRRSRRTRRASS
jgi:biotin carboxylase